MKWLSRVAIALAAALLSPAILGAAAPGTLRIGTEATYPPFEYREPSGALKGFDIDIGNALCARIQVKCAWVDQDFDGLIASLQAGKIDLIISSMAATPDRSKVVGFTRAYYVTPSQLVAPKGSGLTEDPATWKGKTIAVESGTVHQVFAEHRARDVDDKAYQSLEDAYLDLEAGRVDAVFADKVALVDWLDKEGRSKGFDFAGKAVEDPTLSEDIAVAVAIGDTALKEKLNAAIGAILADGTFDRINAAYFPFSIRPK